MRHFALAFVLAFMAVYSMGCASRTDTAPLVRVPTASAVAGCAPSARAVEPGYTLVVAEPTGVVSEVGVRENIDSLIDVPPEAVGCLWDGAHQMGADALGAIDCFLHKLNPKKPTPSVRYTYGSQPAAVAAPSCCGNRCGLPQTPTPIPLPPPPPPSGGGGLEPNIPDAGVRGGR